MAGNDDDIGRDPNFILAVVALFVSVVALVGAVLQLLQQYLASAVGYSNCTESVVGDWARSKHRKFLWGELRFEVRFESPVIFVCPPTNKNGPIRQSPVWHIDGTDASIRETRTKPLDANKIQQGISNSHDEKRIVAKLIHTADNEQSTWVVLLQELQRMERDSAAWQVSQYKDNPPRNQTAQFADHTLCVAVQAKKRSWDSMPSSIRKPYATTTFCHLVEMAAMLGIYWKVFDLSEDRYRGEGNGYVLTGGAVDDLGVLFTLQVSGKSSFKSNRLVPSDLCKELAFGWVSTIFRQDLEADKRRLEFPNDAVRQLHLLQFGSLNEFAETLVSFGCNTHTSNIIRSNDKRHGHLFPIAFELMGMLGKTLHIRNSSFRMIPNPSPYHWDKTYFNMRKLLREFFVRINDTDLVDQDTSHMRVLRTMAEKVYRRSSTRLQQQQTEQPPQADTSLELLDVLHDALDTCDSFLLNADQQSMIEIVLREHVQTVLRYVNSEDDHEHLIELQEHGSSNRDATRHQEKGLRLDDLLSASPEERQERFMDIYFSVVLPRVLTQTIKGLHTIDRTRSSNIMRRMLPSDPTEEEGLRQRRRSGGESSSSSSGTKTTSAEAAAEASEPPEIVTTAPSPDEQARGASGFGLLSPEGGGPHHQHGMEIKEQQATDIWCTLVFRMLCWLMLHDFHKKDVQVSSKSEIMGSRLPAYIG